MGIERPLASTTVEAALGGDEAAFAQIVAAFDDDLARVAYLVTGQVDLAHEAVQAAWSTAWRKLAQLRDIDRLRPWLIAIAVNEARQLLRRHRRMSVREIALDEIVDGARGTVVVDRPPEILDLWAALSRLDPEDREIVAMRYGLGLTSEEIARETGRTATGVRTRLARSMGRLRKELSDV